jgi:ribulose-bisphosphate carboxylase large chain
VAADDLIVTYRVQADGASIDERAEALLLEQTVELPRSALHDAEAAARVVGHVVSIHRIGDREHRVRLAQPAAAATDDPAQVMNVLFGNSSLQPDVVLEDVLLPQSLLKTFGGPRFGIPGLRKIAGVEGRAFTCTALKPMGLTVDAFADLARTFAMAGIDIIKDDHGLGDQLPAPFESRVRACQRAVLEVAERTGRRAVYIPNVMGSPDRLRAQAEIAWSAGVAAVMVAPMLVGLPVFHTLVRDGLGLPVIAHPAFGGAQRIDPEVLLGQLFPIFGADAVIFPSYGGRFSYDRQTCGRLASALRHQPHPLLPARPVAAGGVVVERVPELLAFYGADTALLVGASVLSDADRVGERSRGLVEAVSRPEVTS